MESDSDNDIEGEVTVTAGADWGKAKRDYYYTDYVDKDYPSKLTAKEERLAAIEQEEALRIQKKLLSTLDNVVDIDTIFDDEDNDEKQVQDKEHENLIDILERQNKSLELEATKGDKSKKRKRVTFEQQKNHDEDEANFYEDDDDDDQDEDDEDDVDNEEDEDDEGKDGAEKGEGARKRRPINIAMKKNRGLTPYKKKEYRNPRVKHKLKYKKAMSKRRRNVKEKQTEYHRYSGESTGIKTSTIKSIKLC